MKRPPLYILAGGLGTRLRSVTGENIPKPMVEVFGKPFLYWLLKHYVNQGFSDITLCTGYKAEMIEDYEWPAPVKYLKDDGVLKGWARITETNIWVINGDTYIPQPLPYVDYYSCVLSCGDIDAGAQYIAHSPIHITPCYAFYDIGTPEGLEKFKEDEDFSHAL